MYVAKAALHKLQEGCIIHTFYCWTSSPSLLQRFSLPQKNAEKQQNVCTFAQWTDIEVIMKLSCSEKSVKEGQSKPECLLIQAVAIFGSMILSNYIMTRDHDIIAHAIDIPKYK